MQMVFFFFNDLNAYNFLFFRINRDVNSNIYFRLLQISTRLHAFNMLIGKNLNKKQKQ